MHIKAIGVLGLAAALSGCGGGGDGSRERVLGQWLLQGSGGENQVHTSLSFVFGASVGFPSPPQALFGTAVSVSDVPAVLVLASPADDPEFDDVVVILGDGADGEVSYGPFGTFSGGGSESAAFGRPPGDPDFAGFTITRIELHVDALTLASPGTDPNADGVWTDYTYQVRVVVVGRPN